MWLPKDERKLLSYYYRRINKVETSQNFEMKDLIKVFGEYIFKPLKLSSEVVLCRYKLLENINNLLSRRGLIKWENLNPIGINTLQELPKTSEALGWTESTNVNFRITLTIEEYDLGKKYSSNWLSIKLWYEEYIKNHPIWLLASYIAGIISALLVNWLSSFFGAK